MQAEVLLDSIDMVAGTKSDFADLPVGTRAISLPDNSYTRSSPFLKVFGRPDNASVCECERVQSASLAQSLHLMNAADVKAKLTPDGMEMGPGTSPAALKQAFLKEYEVWDNFIKSSALKLGD